MNFIKPGKTSLISAGIAVKIPSGYFGGIYARSGLSIKEGLRPANCVGVIDADYRGTVMVALYNQSDTARTVEPYERIGQLVIQPYLGVTVNEVTELDETDRGAGGFGSTGK